MKREIIFRGKRLDNGKWEYGDLVHDDIGGMYVFPNDAENLYIEYRVDPDTVGQYTGLTDNNGTKIFEGDIATLISRTYWTTNKVKFTFNKGCFMGILLGKGILLRNLPIGDIPIDTEITIIGNIHDNPELLKGGEETPF